MKKEIKNIIYSIIINVIVFFIYMYFYNMTYETNDEWAFSSFLGGAYGVRSSHLVFSNIFYGGFLELFYSLDLGINWYTVFQLFFCFVSLCVITYIGLMKTEYYASRVLRYIVSFAILIIVAFQHYYWIQWTKSAYLVALAGVLLIFYALHELEGNRMLIFSGILLVLVGSFLRFDSVYVVLAFAFIRCIYDLVVVQKLEWTKEYFQYNCKYIRSFAIMLLLVLGFQIADGLVYEFGGLNEEWKYFKRYNVLRSELLDYGMPSYDENVEAYRSMGLTEVDIAMLRNWTFADPEVFTVDIFEKIVALKQEKEISINDFFNTYSNILEGAKYNIGFIAIIIAILFLLKSEKKQRILFFLYILITVLLYGYLTYVGRVMFRCEYGIWLCLIVFLIYDYPKKRVENKYDIYKWTWLIMSFLILGLSADKYQRNSNIYTSGLQNHYRELFNYTSVHHENLYMRDVMTLSNWTFGYSPLEALPYGYLSNIYLLGGWEVENPITNVEERYSISNPWRECVDSNNIFLIDNSSIDLKVEYIRQRYCDTAEAVLVEEIGGFNIYKIVSN